ncbi:Hypothetical predicted protein [Pelobates cultripes]|uniref:Uncharacterized protein n=1 Tax=Pelobates cultripes TaxID=61616 RepID=A0AAD1S5G4_PELCU|nr:Hypothetical predicted protein [Pelobates cultripes]
MAAPCALASRENKRTPAQNDESNAAKENTHYYSSSKLQGSKAYGHCKWEHLMYLNIANTEKAMQREPSPTYRQTHKRDPCIGARTGRATNVPNTQQPPRSNQSTTGGTVDPCDRTTG